MVTLALALMACGPRSATDSDAPDTEVDSDTDAPCVPSTERCDGLDRGARHPRACGPAGAVACRTATA